MSNRTVLYVSGFSSTLRAKDLAYEFERYGRLIRCDIPAQRTATSSPFAFIEFRREVDAEEAYYDISIEGRRITVQWAKRPPSSAWRHDGFSDPPRERPRDSRDSRDHRDQDRDRRRSPPPSRKRSPSPIKRDSREDGRDGQADRDYDRRRSLSPRRDAKDERRSVSPVPAHAIEVDAKGKDALDDIKGESRDSDRDGREE